MRLLAFPKAFSVSLFFSGFSATRKGSFSFRWLPALFHLRLLSVPRALGLGCRKEDQGSGRAGLRTRVFSTLLEE
jgi:hypothetical protein